MRAGMVGADNKGIGRKLRARRSRVPCEVTVAGRRGRRVTARSHGGGPGIAHPGAPPSPGNADGAVAITTALTAAIAGFEVCARRSRDERTAVAARNAAEFLRVLFASAIALAEDLGIDAHPRKRTCDRLRWEWLASTATVVDGHADGRLLAECSRILTEIVASGAASALGEEIALRLRMASAEAYSLGLAAEYERRRELAFALG